MIDAATLAASLDQRVAWFRRTPYAYRTSHRLDELEVELEDGTRRTMLLKHLSRSRLSAKARRAKPPFLYDPRREVQAYRLLATKELGAPVCYGSTDDWVLLEKVSGVELWQVGDVEAWARAAHWLEQLHGLFTDRPPDGQHLLRYDTEYFRIWPDRAVRHHPALASALGNYERVVELLSNLPVTLVHGEFYASNILVAGSRIAPVDWEMAGIGPGVLDLAALATGWDDRGWDSIVGAYGQTSPDALDAARIHLALQWLGWSREWAAPPEHAHDWLSEAMQAAERLEL